MAYATRANIEQIFGKINVEQWGDLDGNEVQVDITARITATLSDASDYVDDTLRAGPYALPLTATHATIRRLTAIQAGLWLHDARGIQDVDSETGKPIDKYAYHRKFVTGTLKRILAAQLRLDGETDEASMVPAVVTEDVDSDYV